MKFISFVKYKSYLESLGYTLENVKNEYADYFYFITYSFSKEGNKDKYFVNVFTDKNGVGDKIMSISYGHGSLCVGNLTNIKIDFRRKFWKTLICDK